MAGANFAQSELTLLHAIQSLFDQANLSLCGSCGNKSFPGYMICPEPGCEALLPAGIPSRTRPLALGIFNVVLAHLRNHLPPPQGNRRFRQAIRHVVQIENACLQGIQTLATLIDPDVLIALFDVNLLMSYWGAGEE
ncbi:hypothetical protein F52700_2407 [Fusarium sp. NRRL 52700]|nr:hypothetical protein F52700_2407 [Fusarium sp. NRRL 52700]